MQEKIGIITDSTCDLPKELANNLGVEILPLRILYKDREYRDSVDISLDEVYSSLDVEIPSTSLPSPEDVSTLLNKMKAQGYTHIIAIHLSSKLSGTSQMIQTVADNVKDMVVKVIDSKSISMGLGLMVMEAVDAIKSNKSFDAICQHVMAIRKRLSVCFVLDTLEYLKRGGRIGKVSATLGQLLNVKPIITVNEEGVYTTLAKVRGRKKSLDQMFTIAKEKISDVISRVAVCYGGAENEAKELLSKFQSLPNVQQLVLSKVSPVIGVHTGPGTVGFAVLQKDS